MTLAVGADLGGTHLRVAVVDAGRGGARPPEALHERRVAVGGDTAPVAIAQLLARLVQDAEQAAGGAPLPLGIGVAGMLAGHTGVVANAPNLGWRDVDLGALLRARLPGRRVTLHNDVNAIAYGEYAFGAGGGAGDVLTVFVGTGIGGGIVAGDRLLEGASNVAAELGHVKVILGPEARPCGCGARGCVEAYAGGANLARRTREDLAAGARTQALVLAGGDPAALHAGHLDEAARAGDEYARGLWDEVAPLLGVVLANAVTVLNPARLVLGGGVWRGAPDLRRRALAAYETFVNAPSGLACRVVDAELGDDAGILGAAALADARLAAT